MELLSCEIKTQIPALRSQSGVGDPIVYVKLFTSIKSFAWFVLEFDHDDNDTCFGYIFDHDEGEFGYFSLQYLQEQWPMISFQTLTVAGNTIENTPVAGNIPTVAR